MMVDLSWTPMDLLLVIFATILGASALMGGVAIGAAWVFTPIEEEKDPLGKFQAACNKLEVEAGSTATVSPSATEDVVETVSATSIEVPTDIPAVLRRKHGVASRQDAYAQEKSWRERNTRWDLLMLPAPEQKKKRKPRKRKSAKEAAEATSSQVSSKFDEMA